MSIILESNFNDPEPTLSFFFVTIAIGDPDVSLQALSIDSLQEAK